jgi:hypothetical protein
MDTLALAFLAGIVIGFAAGYIVAFIVYGRGLYIDDD